MGSKGIESCLVPLWEPEKNVTLSTCKSRSGHLTWENVPRVIRVYCLSHIMLLRRRLYLCFAVEVGRSVYGQSFVTCHTQLSGGNQQYALVSTFTQVERSIYLSITALSLTLLSSVLGAPRQGTERCMEKLSS